jgi:hypothetical protein
MAQEIFNGFIASFILAGFWTVGRLIARINRLLNSRRIQRGNAEYLSQKSDTKNH